MKRCCKSCHWLTRHAYEPGILPYTPETSHVAPDQHVRAWLDDEREKLEIHEHNSEGFTKYVSSCHAKEWINKRLGKEEADFLTKKRRGCEFYPYDSNMDSLINAWSRYQNKSGIKKERTNMKLHFIGIFLSLVSGLIGILSYLFK